MRQLTPGEFLDCVEQGIIWDVFCVGRRVYGKDGRAPGVGKRFTVVWVDVP